jgi:hypothetical protein
VAYSVYQRAIAILNDEKSWNMAERIEHIKYIRGKSCNPFVEHNQHHEIKKDEGIVKFQDEFRDKMENLNKMEKQMENLVGIKILTIKILFHF